MASASRPTSTGAWPFLPELRELGPGALVGRRLGRLDHRGLALGRALAGALERGGHEIAEERLRAKRPRLELRVELRGDEERVVRQLDDLHEPLVRRGARAHEAGLLEPLAQVVVHLVAVSMALVDHRLVRAA